MAQDGDGLTRRNVLRSGGLLALGSLVGRRALAEPQVKAGSRVVLVRNPEVMDGEGHPRPGVVQEMLDAAVVTLLGTAGAQEAWRRLVKPSDVVGIKSNEWGRLPTTTAVEQAIRTRILQVGVKPDDISVGDRAVLRDPVFQRATALVNARPMRTHHWSGLGTCIKNYVMFVEKPWDYHDNACETLGALWHLPLVKGKTRLNVLVMFTPLFHGVGPHHFNRNYTWPYAGLLVGLEPAPVDAVGAAIITARRREFFGEDRPIAPAPHHITAAGERYGLGAWRLENIDLTVLGEADGALLPIA